MLCIFIPEFHQASNFATLSVKQSFLLKENLRIEAAKKSLTTKTARNAHGHWRVFAPAVRWFSHS
jgi:hypothetical protein